MEPPGQGCRGWQRGVRLGCPGGAGWSLQKKGLGPCGGAGGNTWNACSKAGEKPLKNEGPRAWLTEALPGRTDQDGLPGC